MGDVAVEVNREGRYLGWKTVSIQRSLTAFCGSFKLGFIDAWNFERYSKFPIRAPLPDQKWYLKPGDFVRVYLDSDLVSTSFVDEVTSSMDGENRGFEVSGRDITCDLVDCAARVTDFKGWKNLDVLQMANVLCQPFHLNTERQVSPGKKFPQISLEAGQTCFEVLDHLAKQRGILLTTDENGSLLITKPSKEKAVGGIIEGDNVKSASVNQDFKGRFSKYYVLAQAKGIDQSTGANVLGEKRAYSVANDTTIVRYRPKVVQNERAATKAETDFRARWEANHSAANGLGVSVKLNTWRQGPKVTDPLWKINTLVEVTLPSLAIDGEMLIESVGFSLDENGGEITDLSLKRRDAFLPDPIVKDDKTLFQIGKIPDPPK